MPRVLFVAAHRLNRAPSQRFRFEQYLAHLESVGIECVLSPLLSAADDRLFYGKSSVLLKSWVLARGALRRAKDVRRAGRFHAVFVQREAFFGGWPVFERAFKKSGTPLILDFDDAIWLLDVSEANRRYGWLKRPQKTAEIARLADLVIAGNAFLVDYARTHNPSVRLIPTTIDTQAYTRPVGRSRSERVCIGWTGSTTTIKHFHQCVPALMRVRERHGDRVHFRVIGDGSYRNEALGIKGEPWDPATEVASLCAMDIGIMPLPNDEWSLGKCGLKGLQFMALEIPVVMENLGANKDIVRDGIDGCLATGEDEWVSKLSSLITSPDLRDRLAVEGRKTIEGRFSVNSQKDVYVEVLGNLFRRGPART
jgi:glycosyltransferase involved in cell wall biosynthesis